MLKIKGFWYDGVVVCLSVALSVAFIGIAVFIDRRLAIALGAAVATVIVVALVRFETSRRRYRKFIINLSGRFDYTKEKVLESFPFPAAVCRGDGTIVWCNSRFFSDISGSTVSAAASIDTYTNSIGIESLMNEENTVVSVNDRFFSVSTGSYEYNGETYCILYYLDITMLKKTENEFFMSRPYLLLTQVDTVDDARADYRDSERAEIKSSVESAIADWAEKYSCVMKSLDDDRCMIVARQCDLNRMIEDKFSILETIRDFEFRGKRIGASVAIGVSGGDTYDKCDIGARKALEMALGRGGDQVALKLKDSYKFFGGVSQSGERKNKVRVRVIASALGELIKTSDSVIVMGHKYTDLDAIGSAVGVCCACTALGVASYVVTDTSKTLASKLTDTIEGSGMLINEAQALEKLTKKSLLVVVDTHIESFVEFKSVYDKACTVVVIDHHRRSVGQIENAVIFHHDPSASSACEMVAELLEYFEPAPTVTKQVAQALLAGIMLDTKNFVLRSGVRTFEAAAFLRERGADTVKVKRLFANSMEDNRLRNTVVSSASEYRSCAVAFANFVSKDIRIITSQAADELLNVNDILASFVMFADNGSINISARSLGEVNVQLIMEALGGGGHRTMAACQLAGVTVEQAKAELKNAIDGYFQSLGKDENI